MHLPVASRLLYLLIALMIGSSSALASVSHGFAHDREHTESKHSHGDNHDQSTPGVLSEGAAGLLPGGEHGHPRLDNAPVHVRVSLVLPIAMANVLHVDFNRISVCPSLDADELPGFEATGPPPQVRAPPQV